MAEEAANPLDDVGEDGPDVRPAAEPPPVPPARVEPVLVPRWVQLVLLPVAIAGAYLLLYTAGHVLLLFIIAGLIALLLNPLVTLCSGCASRAARRSAIVMVFVSARRRARVPARGPDHRPGLELQSEVPGYVDDANRELADLQDWLDRTRHRPRVKQEGETALQTIGERLTGGAGEVVGFTRDAVQRLVEAASR